VAQEIRILQLPSEQLAAMIDKSILAAAEMEVDGSAPLRICIVAENASFRFGGEASLPLHYFSRLRARGIEAWLIVHGRTQEELEALFPNDRDRIHFIQDKWFDRLMWRLGRYLPRRIAEATVGTLTVLVNQLIQRRVAKALIAAHKINLIHQPIPVSPRAPSFICKLGVPVVIGPMNGGMEYPPALSCNESWLTRISVALTRRGANLVNHLVPGKKLADILLVANQRTRLALPSCARGKVVEIAENGVDIELWTLPSERSRDEDSARFIFIGRLVDWKRLDLAIRALADVPGARMDVVGDGPMRAEWTALAARLHLGERVSFVGWLPQRECARYLRSAMGLLLPSVYECGGAVVLEALAMGVPTIATAWGGPADYLDETCGILVSPDSSDAVIRGFGSAMRRLIDDPDLRLKLGRSGRKRAEKLFDWERKLDQILHIYRQGISQSSA
jgi:glycosyltransferase involved in cell wall biosynthesis